MRSRRRRSVVTSLMAACFLFQVIVVTPPEASASTPVTTHVPNDLSEDARPTADSTLPNSSERGPVEGPRIELVEDRTADSRTFLNPDGTYTTDHFAAPIFYVGRSGRLEPIDPTPVESDLPDVAFETRASPVRAEFAARANGDLVRIRDGAHSVTFRSAVVPGSGTRPIADRRPEADGQGHVTYRDVFPNVDLRYTALPFGVKEDIVLRAPVELPHFAFEIHSRTLTPRLEADGSVTLESRYRPVFTLPAPFMVDSADERDGDGARSTAVRYRIVELPGRTLLVVEADEAWLADPARVYPVYIDPTTTSYGGSADTFISSGYPITSLNAQWNPSEGGYYELWNGYYDSNNYAFIKTGHVTNRTVISATFNVYVQHAYSGATATGIQLGRLTSGFTESQTWNMTHPSFVALTSDTVADNQWASFNVTSTAQAWADGATNYGFRVYQSSTSVSLWKRLRARENSLNTPYLSINYTLPSATPSNPTGTEWARTGTLSWLYSSNGSTYSQQAFSVQVSKSSTSWTGTDLVAASGSIYTAASSWTAPTTNWVNGTTYYWRMTVYDGHGWSGWGAPASFRYDGTAASFISSSVGDAVSAVAPSYYDLGNGTFTIKIRGSDANSGIRLTYLRLYNATDEMRVQHDWSVSTTDCVEGNTSTLVDATACTESYVSGGIREVTFTVVGRGASASFDVHYYFTDYAGNTVGYVDTGLNVVFDATAPAATISSPAVGGTVGGTVDIMGTATDANFRAYEVHRGTGSSPSTWSSIGTNPRTAPVSAAALAAWNTTGLADGVYTIRLRVFDHARVSSGFTEVRRTVTVDNSRPIATITSPAAETAVRGTVSIVGSASANWGFDRYTLHTGAGCEPTSWADIGTNPRTTPVTSGTLGSWNTSGLQGLHAIRLIVTESGGETNSTTVCVTVDNEPAEAIIESPQENLPVAGDVVITGTAADDVSMASYQVAYGEGPSPAAWTTIATSTTAVDSGTLATWDTGALVGAYSLRLSVTDTAGNPAAVATRTIYVENGMRGADSQFSRVPFELGGELRLAVGVANGELTVERTLFTIPSYGPSASLTLAYSSLGSSDARFGPGWTSNLTQHLTFDAGFVVWHDASGGRVPFGDVGSAWIPLIGHATLERSGATIRVTLPDQSVLVFEGSAAGRLLGVEDQFGNSLTVSWGASSVSVTDASGRVTQLLTDAATTRVTSATDSAGRTWEFAYDLQGNLATLTDPLGHETVFSYDAAHRMVDVTRTRSEATGQSAPIEWAVAYSGNRVSSVVDPLNPTAPHTFEYDGGTSTVSLLHDVAADPDVRAVTAYELDSRGRPLTVLDAEGSTTARTYSDRGDLLSVSRPIDAATSVTTSYEYDARGNVLRESVVAGALSLVTVTEYNADNQVTSRTEAHGTPLARLTEYAYDAEGHLTSMTVNPQTVDAADANLVATLTYTARDQVATSVDAMGRVTRFQYDVHGNLTHETQNYVPSAPSSPDVNVTTEFEYNTESLSGRMGLVTRETDARGHAVMYGYDALGRRTLESYPGDSSIPALTRTTTYDELGNAISVTDAWAATIATTTRTYDGRNRLVAEVSPQGQSTFDLDAAGNVVSTTSPDGTTSRSFDRLGRTVEEVSAGGTRTTRSYDAQGHETSTAVWSGPTAAITERVFDGLGRLTTDTVDPSGAALTTTYAYDVLGQRIAATDPSGLAENYEYDAVGRVVATDRGGLVSETTYDKVGNPITEVSFHAPGEVGSVTRSSYDALGRVTEVIKNYDPGSTDQLANITESVFVDEAGNVVARRDPDGTVSTTVWNVRGLAMQTIDNCTDVGHAPTTDPAGCDGDGVHDSTTNVVSDLRYDGPGQLVSRTDHAVTGGVVTSHTRDLAGRIVRTVVDAGSGRLNLTTEFAYDGGGRKTAERDPRGTVTRWFYDPDGLLLRVVENCSDTAQEVPTAGWASCAATGDQTATWNVTTAYAYDDAGRRILEVAPNGRQTRHVYDNADRLIATTENYVATAPFPADANLTTHYHFDSEGRQTAVRVPAADGQTFVVRRMFYDELGRLIREVENCTDVGLTPPAAPESCSGLGTNDATTNITTTYSHDSEGRVVSITRPSPAAAGGSGVVTTRHAYDGAGNLCRVVENATVGLQDLADPCTTPLAGTSTVNVSTTYTYDASAHLIGVVDADGSAITYGYDALGRMVSTTDAVGGTTTWTFDERGNRVGQVNRGDSTRESPTIAWMYDAAGRMTQQTADGSLVDYEYDAKGNLVSASGPHGEITATYDRLDRPLVVTAEDGATTSYEYDHDAPGRSDPSGSYEFTLDAFGRVTTTADPLNTVTVHTAAYRADGQPAERRQPNGNVTNYEYDAIGRLISTTTTGAGGIARASYTYTYNAAGFRTLDETDVVGDPTNGESTYLHDQLGRLIRYVDSGGEIETYGWESVPNRVLTQTGSQPEVTTSFDAAHRPTSDSAGSTYAHDADGRLTAMPGQALAWDSLGRLTGITPASGGGAQYEYDALGRLRAADTADGTRVRFRYVGLTDAVAQLVDDASDDVVRSVATGWFGERLFEWTDGGVARYFGTNAHHDVTWLAGADGAVTGTARYHPWGARSTSGTGTEWGFQGAWTDGASSLVWINTRWYSPTMGRFVSEDSIVGDPKRPASRHPYAYAEGAPLDRWDPDGRFWYSVKPGDSLSAIATRFHGYWWKWPTVWNANRFRVPNPNLLYVGQCLWVHNNWYRNECSPPLTNNFITGMPNWNEQTAASTLGLDWYNLTAADVRAVTIRETGRQAPPLANWQATSYINNGLAITDFALRTWRGTRYVSDLRGWTRIYGNSTWPPSGYCATTFGYLVYYRCGESVWLDAHEYVHTMQYEAMGWYFYNRYLNEYIDRGGGPRNRLEAMGYLWEGWTRHFYLWELEPWQIWPRPWWP